MSKYLQRLRRFFGSDDGPTAVEYSVMLALILLICAAGARTLGCNMQAAMTTTASELGNK